MYFRIFRIFYLLTFLLSASMMILITSCRSENFEGNDNMVDSPVTISGGMASYVLSRDNAYNPTEIPDYITEINEGKFNLIYPNTGNDKLYAIVDFDITKDGIGFVTKTDNKELAWSDVGTSANYWFSMDNLPLDYTEQSSPVSVSIPNDSPYRISELSKDNDLLWGRITTQQSNHKLPVEIELHHKLSLFRVKIKSKETLDNATLILTQMIGEIKSFNRTTGVVTSGFNHDTSVILVGENQIWDYKNPDEEEYITKPFILPPQVPLGGEERSQLKITIPEENGNVKTYAGYLPYSMTVYGDETYSSSFEFLEEKFLTINVTINSEEARLEFAPVTYIDWVNKGSYTFSSFQEGIYNADDFKNFIAALKNGKIVEMKKYGYQNSDNVWEFQIWSDFEINYNDIYGSLKNVETSFKFVIGSHTITILNSNESKTEINQDNIDKLISILKGNS